MNYILYIALFCLSFSSFAQQPEQIKKITVESKDAAYYKQQMELWKEYLNTHKQEENAWYNYFLSTRYYNSTLQMPYEESKSKMLLLFDEMGKAIPNTFTYNLTKSWDMGVWDKDSFEYILKAYQLKPADPQVLIELIVRYEVYGPAEKRTEFVKKYYDLQVDSPELLNVCYNLMASLEPNAIVFTEGDNDTFPLWMLQDALNIRKDVIVLNTSLICLDEYRERIFKEHGIILPADTINELKIGVGNVKKSIVMLNKIVEVLATYTQRPIYISHTVDEKSEIRKYIKDRLYVVGLASQYSKKRIDNTALIKRHYENDFLLDYILLDFRRDEKASIIKWVNQIYLGPFTTLYKHYVLSGEEAKARRIKKYIDVITTDNNLEASVEQLIR